MDKHGTGFLDDVVGRTTRPRFNRWGGEIVIDGNGQVRFHQKILQALGDLPEQPRILVASPDVYQYRICRKSGVQDYQG